MFHGLHFLWTCMPIEQNLERLAFLKIAFSKKSDTFAHNSVRYFFFVKNK